MPRQSVSFLALLAFFISAGAARAKQDRPAAAPSYGHAYYLFLADEPVACEACYVPLLITVTPLEETAKNPAGQDCMLITTYERDSIFQMNGIVRVTKGDVQAAPRMVRVRKRSYRYQGITASEVLKLLENPQGTIPISRTTLHFDLASGPSLENLKAAFRAAK